MIFDYRPMGPLELADYVGLDTNKFIIDAHTFSKEYKRYSKLKIAMKDLRCF